VATKYSPAEFLPFVPQEVADYIRDYARNFVANGPRSSDELVLLESFRYKSSFYEDCTTEEELLAKLEAERNRNKKKVFDAVYAIHKYFTEQESANVTPNTSLERTREE